MKKCDCFFVMRMIIFLIFEQALKSDTFWVCQRIFSREDMIFRTVISYLKNAASKRN